MKYTYKKVISTGPRPHIVYEDGKARANFTSKKDAKSFLSMLRRK